MSTKSTIFLTNDHNEHCYFETGSPCFKDEKFIGYSIVVEVDKKNAPKLHEDEWDFCFELTNPESEIYKRFRAMDPSNDDRYYLKQLFESLVKSGDDININSELKEKIKKRLYEK